LKILLKTNAVQGQAGACIKRSGSPEYLGLEDAVLMTKIIEAVYKSDKAGQTVKF
jgi:predicted dehydrogenase